MISENNVYKKIIAMTLLYSITNNAMENSAIK